MGLMLKRSLEGIAIVALALASAFAGGTYGFMQGYVHGIGDTGARAVTLTTALRSLRSGEVEKGISQLEGNLDTLVIEHWATNRDGPPILSWLIRSDTNDATDRRLFGHVARYRSDHPSRDVVPEVKQVIDFHLKSFQDQ